MPTADEFREALLQVMNDAFKNGKAFVDIRAGELHARVGGYPGPDHRMPNCCQVMRASMAVDFGDNILEQPASGQGASLTIRYILPRQE